MHQRLFYISLNFTVLFNFAIKHGFSFLVNVTIYIQILSCKCIDWIIDWLFWFLWQVLRIPAGKDKPDFVLGEKFVPGSDLKHFCKPSDVIVLKTGEFFVSDG